MNSEKALRALLVVSLALIASAARAGGLPQSYADVGYVHTNYSDHSEYGSFEMDGGLVDASFGIHEYVNLRAGFTRAATSGFSGDTPDFTEFRVGVRPHYGFSDRGDVFVDLLYFNNKLNGNRTTETDIGGIYGAGVRYRLFKKAELLVAGEYRSGEVDEAYVVIGPVIQLTKNLSLNVKTSQASDSQEHFAGIRIEF